MSNKKETSGKKVAYIVIGSIIAASIFAVIVITLFFNMYDPSKYGRNNGGVDEENRGAPVNNIEGDSSPLTDN
ncbi:MAG: hypothetical protein ABS882_01145 [Lysinibacillus sp.]